MKKLILLIAVILLISFPLNSQETIIDEQYYRVLAFKFKYGKAEEATERGMNLFNKARRMIGLDNMVFKSESGPYDLLVFDPVKKESAFHDEHWEKQRKKMVEIMGSEEALLKELESWSDLVESQETFYYKLVKPKD